ncbi:unnamed protein product [Thelazia callipaeda]|uniref:39S ribosomal protein L9, mitochondrial n=1 Tax=Thelazia callipaeda TaxID=103827 RepID=A0A0N5CJX7_THECL|nr:unnamed protein product [Thelazia callipaeda]
MNGGTFTFVSLLRTSLLAYSASRNLLRPRRNIPFRGIYRTEGDLVRKDDLLVCQHKINFHPGLNVYLKRDQSGQLLLKAMSDGHVMITQEKVNPDFSIPEMFANEGTQDIQKLTFNVIPLNVSQSFRLVNEI